MPIEEVITIHRKVNQCYATEILRDGTVLWELQEKKCQQRVWNHSTVVQTGQAG